MTDAAGSALDAFAAALGQTLGATAEIQRNFALAPWTSVRVGGAADVFVKPLAPEALLETLRRAKSEGLPLHVLGGGANTLVGDAGVRGVTLKLPTDLFPESIEQDDDGATLTLCAGAAIARLITRMKSQKLVGAEFLAGIPGTLGGALSMNAGTKNGECMTVVEAVECFTPEGDGWLSREQLRWEYRHTHLPEGAVLTRIKFRLKRGDLADSQQRMEADLGYRKRTQPLSQPNSGSVFRNPPGHHAGALVEKVGLKGEVEGKAQISPMHANWIVNLGGATARDVETLMMRMQQRVQEQCGVSMVLEVKRIGEFVER